MVFMTTDHNVKSHIGQCEISHLPPIFVGVKSHTMIFVDRLRHFMEQRGFNQKSLSLACGFGETAVRDFLKGSEPSVSRGYRLAQVLGLRIEDLLGEDYLAVNDEVRIPDEDTTNVVPIRHQRAFSEVMDGVTRIPELDVRLAAGGGQIAESESIIGDWMVPTTYVTQQLRKNPNRMQIVTVVGNSMEPRLQNGDRIGLDLSDTNPTPPGMFALWDGFGLVVKNVQRVHRSEPAKLLLTSENTSFPPYEVFVEDITIIGRVVMLVRAV